jgi:hypothetical protein
VPESKNAVGIDLRRVVDVEAEIRNGFRDEAVTDEGEKHGQPVAQEATAPVRVERESHEREQDRAGREHSSAVDRAEGREQGEDERDHGEASPQPNGAGLLGRRAGVEKDGEAIERPEKHAGALHHAPLRRSVLAWPSARSRSRIHHATSAYTAPASTSTT